MCKYISVRARFLILLLAMVISYIVLRAVNTIDTYNIRVEHLVKNYENFARTVSTSCLNYIEDIWTIEEIMGIHLINNSELYNREDTNYLNTIRSKVKGIQSIAILDADGNIIASSPECNYTEILPKESINEIKAGKEKLIASMKGTNLTDGYSVSIARAVEGKEKLLIAVTVDLKKVEEYFPKLLPGGNIHLTLIDNKGIVVYSSNQFIPAGKSVEEDSSVNSAISGEKLITVGGFSSIDNAKRIGIDFPIQQIGWDCRVSSPNNITVGEFYKQIVIDIAILVILVTVLVFIMIFMNRRVIRPITALRESAEKLMQGDHSARTNIEGNDEISLAAEAFDKMAESIEQWNTVRTQCFMNMSHEIKTPINVIFSSVQLIENYKFLTDFESYKFKVSTQMKIIRQNCYRLIRLTRNLLDLCRHDNGVLKMKLNNYDIVNLVKNITTSVKRYTEAKGIKLVFSSEVNSRIMACDPDMIERILLNLISNALKFTDRDGTITVRIMKKEDNLILIIKDTGVGIPENKLKCIFEQFGQADDPSNRNQEGSGIGLSLVKAFIDAHGGDITVESEVMKGTKFIITLPIKTIEPDTEKSRNNVPTGVPPNVVSRINIEFSDIYSGLEEIRQERSNE